MNDLLFTPSEAVGLSNQEPPHSVEAEQAVLGGLLRENQAWMKVSGYLAGDDFFRGDHRLIFKALEFLAESGKAMDVVTLNDVLETNGHLEAAGGLSYLSELYENTFSVANIVSYARVISERARLRSIIKACDDIEESALRPEGKSADDLVHLAEQAILGVAGTRPKEGGPVGLEQLLSKAVNTINTLNQSGGEAIGLSTGFEELDKRLNYLRPADLVIVAGRPSMGKTSFAMNIVESAIQRSEKVVVVYSLEMPGDTLVSRMISSIGGIEQSRVRSGQLLDEDWPKLVSAAEIINQHDRVFIDDTANLSPSEMRSITRRIRRVHGEIGLIMVDYLQLMRVPGAGGLNRTNEISEISRSLKALAKEFDCPVVALSQLNRSLEQRPNKRPINSDLRESGAIEQDADVILFVYRDEIYNPDSRFKGTAEIIIGKQREGPIGFVRLGFDGRYTRFEELKAGSHEFTDAEMGVPQVIRNPRLGRVNAHVVATAVKAEKERRSRTPRAKRRSP